MFIWILILILRCRVLLLISNLSCIFYNNFIVRLRVFTETLFDFANHEHLQADEAPFFHRDETSDLRSRSRLFGRRVALTRHEKIYDSLASAIATINRGQWSCRVIARSQRRLVCDSNETSFALVLIYPMAHFATYQPPCHCPMHDNSILQASRIQRKITSKEDTISSRSDNVATSVDDEANHDF